MKLQSLRIGISLAIFLILSGCAKHEDNRTISNLIEHFNKSGLAVTGQEDKNAAIIGAASGGSMEISGHNIEIYRYDIKDESQQAVLKKIEESKTLSVFGTVVPAKVNGSFVLVGYQGHPGKDIILKAFESWPIRAASATEKSVMPPIALEQELLAGISGVWKLQSSASLIKLNITPSSKVFSIIDGGDKHTTPIKIASVDVNNKTANLIAEKSGKSMTVKYIPASNSIQPSNLQLTFDNGEQARWEFVRKIDASDDLSITIEAAPVESPPVPLPN